MAKKKFEVEIYSYGEYSLWDKKSQAIPKLIKITDEIQAAEGTEFGYVLRIRKAKGSLIHYRIDHPSFKDETGLVMPPFTGDVRISSNDYRFFLGDCIWAPYEEKMGKWTMTTYIDDTLVAQKTLLLVAK